MRIVTFYEAYTQDDGDNGKWSGCYENMADASAASRSGTWAAHYIATRPIEILERDGVYYKLTEVGLVEDSTAVKARALKKLTAAEKKALGIKS